jgi:hypothetical protein
MIGEYTTLVVRGEIFAGSDTHPYTRWETDFDDGKGAIPDSNTLLKL